MRKNWTAIFGLLLALSGCGSANQPASSNANDGTAPSGEEPAGLAAGAPAEFAVCTGCHSIVAGQMGVGPSLHGIVGRRAGSLPGYDYSTELRHSGIVWTPERLDSWLSGPMVLVPGTKMSFGGYSDPKQRQAVIGYLKTLR